MTKSSLPLTLRPLVIHSLILLVISVSGLKVLLSFNFISQFFTRSTSPIIRSRLVPLNPIPSPVPTPIPNTELMAWLPWWDQANVVNSLETAAPMLSVISPSWYRLNQSLNLEPVPSVKKDQIENIAQIHGVALYPTVGNDLDGDRAAQFLAQPDLYQPFIDALVSEASASGYQGYDVDFEMIPPDFAGAYLDFLTRLSQALSINGLKLSVAVHAQTGTNDWDLALSHNYAAIGQIADQVRLMIYDYHGQSTGPGPITPQDFLANVIGYAKTQIPISKIVVGLPLYGYDWSDQNVSGLTFKEITKLGEDKPIAITRDPLSQELIGMYSQDAISHTLYYQDAQATVSKINQSQALGIYRFVFWRLGQEDPDTWPLIASSSALLLPQP